MKRPNEIELVCYRWRTKPRGIGTKCVLICWGHNQIEISIRQGRDSQCGFFLERKSADAFIFCFLLASLAVCSDPGGSRLLVRRRDAIRRRTRSDPAGRWKSLRRSGHHGTHPEEILQQCHGVRILYCRPARLQPGNFVKAVAMTSSLPVWM